MRSEKRKPHHEDAPGPDGDLTSAQHTTVLQREAVELLQPRPGGVYVDGTLGGGGHAEELLKRSGPDGVVVGLDQDSDAIGRSRARLASFGARAVIGQENFRNMAAALQTLGIGMVDGILLDLGLSWFHLRSAERGFSFQTDGPLDMRMDPRSGATAADLVNSLPRHELIRILREYGEEKKAVAIAKAIEQARSREPISSTVQLAQVVSRVFPPYPPRRTHPATLTFQALRIAVNDELGALRDALAQAVPLLRPGGRIAVISFHSLEDRIVKQAFVEQAKACVCPPRFPVCRCAKRAELTVVTRRPVTPSEEEIARNPAARSAKLRAAERTPGERQEQGP